MANTIIGVMGPGRADTSEREAAYELGKRIAAEGWTLLTGGRSSGVMEAASKGAREAGGLTVGVLPGPGRSGMSEFVDVPIVTGMGSARNNINVLSSDLVIACGAGMGTTSEIMLAAKARKPVILLKQTEAAEAFLKQFKTDLFYFASTPSEAVDLAKQLLL